MSELIQKNDNRATIRWKLLTSVSAAALLASVYAADEAHAADQDADRPTVWIELGGQLERLGDSQEALSPSFMASVTQPSLLSALNVQHSPTYALDEEGKISFQPENSDWVFSASIRYGRSSAAQHRHQQTPNPHIPIHVTFSGVCAITYLCSVSAYPTYYKKFADGTASRSEAHAVLDFQAGKDVGLGLFGGTSVLSAGVRFAQFTSQAQVTLRARPDVHYPTAPINSLPAFLALFKYPRHFHNYTAIANSQRSFRGIGPSISWNASAPFAGSPERGELTFDWGANAAILFGRQKAAGHHQTTSRTYSKLWFHHYSASNPPPHSRAAPFNRTRTVTVPNFGGFAGLSYRIEDFKVSLGYRGDFFFGAIDGGIDTRKSENRAFYGPFANVSVGLGD